MVPSRRIAVMTAILAMAVFQAVVVDSAAAQNAITSCVITGWSPDPSGATVAGARVKTCP